VRFLTNVLIAAAVVLAESHLLAAQSGLRIEVSKTHHALKVIRDGRMLRTFHASFGWGEGGTKIAIGDGRTPTGVYHVYEKRPSERFRWFLALNYPDSQDADRAFEAGRIDADTWADIWVADRSGDPPPYNTPLGAFVGIHGTGAEGRVARLRQGSDWTDGCIALSDSDIDELVMMTPVGTEVDIRE
jgi:murein L,D-transpeptidase YafK